MLYMQPKFEDYLWNRNLWEVLSWPISFVWMLLILVGASGPVWGFLAIAALIAILVLVDNRAADEVHTTREDPDDRHFW